MYEQPQLANDTGRSSVSTSQSSVVSAAETGGLRDITSARNSLNTLPATIKQYIASFLDPVENYQIRCVLWGKVEDSAVGFALSRIALFIFQIFTSLISPSWTENLNVLSFVLENEDVSSVSQNTSTDPFPLRMAKKYKKSSQINAHIKTLEEVWGHEQVVAYHIECFMTFILSQNASCKERYGNKTIYKEYVVDLKSDELRRRVAVVQQAADLSLQSWPYARTEEEWYIGPVTSSCVSGLVNVFYIALFPNFFRTPFNTEEIESKLLWMMKTKSDMRHRLKSFLNAHTALCIGIPIMISACLAKPTVEMIGFCINMLAFTVVKPVDPTHEKREKMRIEEVKMECRRISYPYLFEPLPLPTAEIPRIPLEQLRAAIEFYHHTYFEVRLETVKISV